MINQEIERLLAQRASGRLDADGEARLLQLTRRDEVIAKAERRSATTRRLRRGALVSIACVGLVVAWIALSHRSAEPDIVVASQTAPIHIAPEPPKPVLQPVASPVAQPQNTPAASEHRAHTTSTQAAPTHATVATEPKVVCNNACVADSVISDIWKFLSA